MMLPKLVATSTPRQSADTGDQVGLISWLAIGLAVAVIGLALMGASSLNLGVFEFKFNPYALISLVAVLSNVIVLVFIARVKAKTDDIVWFSLYITCLMIWAAGELLARLSANSQTFVFWSPLSALPSFLAPVMLFMFALAYTRPKQARHIGTVISLFAGAVVLIFFDLRSALFNHYDASVVVATPWNGAVAPADSYLVATGWIVGLTVLSIALLVRYYRQTQESTLKRQAGLFVIATLIPIGIGAVTDGLLSALNIFNVVPLAAVLTTVSAGIITYGIVRYRFLAFSPVVVAAGILETINEAVIGIKPDLSINYANRGAQELLGYAAGGLLTRSFASFLDGKWDDEKVKKVLFASMASGRDDGQDPVDLRTVAGEIATVKLSVSPVVEDGETAGYLVAMTDISNLTRAAEIIEQTVAERTREVQETKATLEASLNSLKLGFVITDERPEVIRMNSSAHGLFCRSKDHAAGDCHDVTMKDVQALMGDGMNLAEAVKDCMHRQLPHEFKNVGFTNRSWQVYLSPMVVDRESIGCAVLLQDTTDAQILERSRDEFFSIASHELRTPLTSIKGNSSMIMEYYAKILKDPVLKEMVEDIHDSSGRLIEIVNDFLDVSRLEQGRIEFHMEQLSVSKTIEEVVYGTTALVKQKGVHLSLSHDIRRLDGLPSAVADRNRLKQILFNLIGNAVKFTPKGGRISIDASATREYIRVTVADSGVGISPEYQVLLFHKFQQASDSLITRDTTQGTGLGLYISRLLATGMGGTLELAESVPGKGSVFVLKLLVATPARLTHLNESRKTLDPKSGMMVDAPKSTKGKADKPAA